MTDEQSFLAAIEADSSDVSAKLVYADWLQDHDREADAQRMRVLAEPHVDAHREHYAAAIEAVAPVRAKFIRWQLEYAAWVKAHPKLSHDSGYKCGNPECYPVRDLWCEQCLYFNRLETLIARALEWDETCRWFTLNGIRPAGYDGRRYPKTGTLVWHPWLDSRSGWHYGSTVAGEVARGFVGSLTMDGDDVTRHLARIRNENPIESVALTRIPSVSYTDEPENFRRSYFLSIAGGPVESRKRVYVSRRWLQLNKSTTAPAIWAGIRLLRLTFPGIAFTSKDADALESTMKSRGTASPD